MCLKWNCTEDGWKCDNTKCIRKTMVCDGDSECEDKSDENDAFCENWTCLEGFIKCADNRQCVVMELICDGSGFRRCKDGSDENICLQTSCPTGMWRCHNDITCIEERNVCYYLSWSSNCPDESDTHQDVCQNWTLEEPVLRVISCVMIRHSALKTNTGVTV